MSMQKAIAVAKAIDFATTPEAERPKRAAEASAWLDDLKKSVSLFPHLIYDAELQQRPGEGVWRAFHIAAGKPPPVVWLIKNLPAGDDSIDNFGDLWDAFAAGRWGDVYVALVTPPAIAGLVANEVSPGFTDRAKEAAEEFAKQLGEAASMAFGVLIVGGMVVGGIWLALRVRR